MPRDDDDGSVSDDSLYTTTADDNHHSVYHHQTPMKSVKQRHKTPYHPSKTGMILRNDGALEQVSPPATSGSRALVLPPPPTASLLSPSPSASTTTTTTTTTASDSPVSFFEGLRLKSNHNGTTSAFEVATTTTRAVVGLPYNGYDNFQDSDDRYTTTFIGLPDEEEYDACVTVTRRGKKRKSSLSSSTWSTVTHEGSSPESFATAFPPTTPTTMTASTMADTPTISNIKSSLGDAEDASSLQYYTAMEDEGDDSPSSVYRNDTVQF